MFMIKVWNFVEEKTHQEDGEVASWLIVAAALAAAAVVAVGILTNVIETLAGNVETEAGI